jgi:Ca-activated chloride channel family protein
MFRSLTHARILALLALLLAFVVSSAQDAAPEKPTKTETPLIRLNVMITDKQGRAVSDIKAEDLRLFVDGAEQQIKYFSKEEQPVSYGLVVDNSASLKEQIKYVIAAAKLITDSNTPSDETFIVRFVSSDEIKIMQDFTADESALGGALEDMFIEGGQTAFIDAIYLSAQHLLKNSKLAGDKPRRHALVLISDGDDRASYYKADDLFKLLRRSDIQIFSIGLTAALDKERGFISQSKREKSQDLLKRLAAETYGQVFFAEKVGELKDAITEVINILHTQYVLGYVPAPTTGGSSKHKIEIRVIDVPGREKLKAIFKPEYGVAGSVGSEIKRRRNDFLTEEEKIS